MKITYSDSPYGYQMSPEKRSHDLLYGREVSTGDPEKHRAMEISENYQNMNGITSSKSTSNLQRHSNSSTSVNDENYDSSLFLLRPAENRFVAKNN
jgi:hypothetical protein